MKMLDNKVAIEVLKESAKKGGLLHIPDDNFNAGKVAFMGPECKDIEVGQLVCFGPERETIKSNGKEYIIMLRPNIYGILDGEEN